MPVNTLIALCTPGDRYPSPLADAGYCVSGIEVPVGVPAGRVVIDAVLFRADRNIILAGEVKSGANVDEKQARRYGQLKSDDVVVATSITIRETGERQVQPVYVCLTEHVDRVLQGLGAAGLSCPVLTVGENRIEHRGAAFIDGDVEAAFKHPLAVPGAPPRIIPVDCDSPDEAFDTLVLAALVAALSRRQSYVNLTSLAEQALPHLVIFGKAARNRLIAKIDSAARRAAQRDPSTFEYLSRTAMREYPVVRFIRSPEEAARQGRTQVYQSIARAAGKVARRRRTPSPDQMALFDDLIEELQQATDGVPEPNETPRDEEDEG